MKRLFSSWKFYVVIIVIGFALWVAPEIVELIKPKPISKAIYKSAPYVMLGLSKSLYQEAKEWAKIVGQLLAGIGGVGSSIKILIGLFQKKPKP
ncbi:MAG: hypothetical protein MUP27_08865 [Desulfobacterales bacterium]|nr:hypothetical protein [Desulfobacterales bacterium]